MILSYKKLYHYYIKMAGIDEDEEYYIKMCDKLDEFLEKIKEEIEKIKEDRAQVLTLRLASPPMIKLITTIYRILFLLWDE